MIALHAYRSAAAIAQYRAKHPQAPMIIALGGTDVNRFLTSHPEKTLRSMDFADALVGLHDLVAELLPKRLQKKLHVIRQSARSLERSARPRTRTFDICVIGQLRDEKDPLRTSAATRLLPASSQARIVHLGGATTTNWKNRAEQEMRRNRRYKWRGEVAAWQVRRELAQTRVMVISSTQEGGANIVGEAIVAGVPVIASGISGNYGLLGNNYRGYYPVGDTQALANVLQRAENEPQFLKMLSVQCAKLAPSFAPEREQRHWAKLIADVTR